MVLEGGGMRGMFTSGVLDSFMDNNLYINNIYAVSAGCYNALSYISRQRGRTFEINSLYLKDKRYINFLRFFSRKGVINADFIFNNVFKELNPFDYGAFKENVGEFYSVSTNCVTGEANYARITDVEKDVGYIKASAALPLFAELVNVNDCVLTDGGVSDSVPVKKALEDGYSKIIIILTRPKGFVLRDNKLMKYYRVKYKKYPNLINKMKMRKYIYNQTLEYIEKLEKEGKVVVVRPEKDLNIGNLERNADKINQIYKMGYNDGLNYISKIKEYIKVK